MSAHLIEHGPRRPDRLTSRSDNHWRRPPKAYRWRRAPPSTRPRAVSSPSRCRVEYLGRHVGGKLPSWDTSIPARWSSLSALDRRHETRRARVQAGFEPLAVRRQRAHQSAESASSFSWVGKNEAPITIPGAMRSRTRTSIGGSHMFAKSSSNGSSRSKERRSGSSTRTNSLSRNVPPSVFLTAASMIALRSRSLRRAPGAPGYMWPPGS